MITHGFATTNQIRMHYASAGDGQPLVILLHGFPEFWYSWRHQLPALAAAGFRAVAPDLRGWGQTDRPRGVAAYRTDLLLADIDGLRAALGYDRAHIVGHDWGGALAWLYAMRYPERTERLCVLNCPHPTALKRLIRQDAAQRRKSWYIALFQIPWLPEALSRLMGYANIRRELTRLVHPEAMSETDLERYMENVRQPGALTAGINYYRAMGWRSGSDAGAGSARSGASRIAAPTRIIWGRQDAYLEAKGAELSLELCPPGTRIDWIEDAGHWVQLERPDLVNRYLTEFLTVPGA